MSAGLRQRAGLLVRLSETWLRRPPTPNRLVMAVTRRCNLRCSMCRTWAAAPKRPELSAKEIHDALRPVSRLTWLDVTGGEILLRSDIQAVFDGIVDAASALRVLHFPTNGWDGDSAVALTSRVRRQRPDVELLITVSIDGPPSVHDAMRGRPGAFGRAIETLRRLRDIPGAAAYVGTTVGSENAAHLDELERILVDEIPGFSRRQWHWNWLQISPHYFQNQEIVGTGTDPAPALLDEHIRQRGLPRNMVELAELGFLLNLSAHLHGEPTHIPCQALRSTAFLSPEGDLYPCHVWDQPLGNVRDESIPRLWRSAALKRVRAAVQAGRCPGCFTACEAYPAMAGAPVASAWHTARRLVSQLRRW